MIQAFRSTLEDSIEADLLLHVIDASDVLRQNKVQVVDAILDDIGATQPRVYILNKLDCIDGISDDAQRYDHPEVIQKEERLLQYAEERDDAMNSHVLCISVHKKR